MKMVRHYFIGTDLDDLEQLERQLEAKGIATPQIHIYSKDEAGVARHEHLHEVQSFMKSDVIHSTKRAAAFGVVAAVLVLALAYLAGWTNTAAGWMPFIFLAVVMLGFITWQGGLWGIQTPNHHFTRFDKILKEGKHVFFVDVLPDQEGVLEEVVRAHPRVEAARTEATATHWFVAVQQKLGMIRHT